MTKSRNAVIDLIRGVVAGAAATWVMGQATTWLYERESRQVRDREDRARGGGTAYGNAAERVARALGVGLSEEQRERAGTVIHWATGIAAGAVYQALRDRWSRSGAAAGLTFGAALFLIMDEAMNPLLGLTPGPAAFPWQAHARGLAGHLAFGATAELVLGRLGRVA